MHMVVVKRNLPMAVSVDCSVGSPLHRILVTGRQRKSRGKRGGFKRDTQKMKLFALSAEVEMGLMSILKS